MATSGSHLLSAVPAACLPELRDRLMHARDLAIMARGRQMQDNIFDDAMRAMQLELTGLVIEVKMMMKRGIETTW
jgi:hypothetical protein